MDDFRILNLDRLQRRDLKTAEQISQHTLSDSVEAQLITRALHLLHHGDELQRISVMKDLPSLIQEDLNAPIEKLMPEMEKILFRGTTEYKIAACEAVREVAEQRILTPDKFTEVFLKHIMKSLEREEEGATEEWMSVLLDVIPGLPPNVLQNEILQEAIKRSRLSRPPKVRITSCRILGQLALSFTASQIKKDINPLVISLCQDVKAEVRAAMTYELPNISANLGLETGQCFLSLVLELMSDDDITVREAAIQALAPMLPRFTPEQLKTTIIPLCKRVFAEVKKYEDERLIVLAKYYGQYCCSLKSVMTAQDRVHFFQLYTQMSELNSNTRRKLDPYKPVDDENLALRFTQVREQCAYNFPGMVVFAADLKSDNSEMLLATLRNLAGDSYWKVRRKIAAGLHEVVKLMPNKHSSLKTEFVKLLRDPMDTVLEGIVTNTPNILLGLQTADRFESSKDVGQALIDCEKTLSECPRWRVHEQMLVALRVVVKVFPPEFNCSLVTTLMIRAANLRILPCKVAALQTVLVILADPAQSKQRSKIRSKILELCNNSSFSSRSVFLRGMSFLLQFSPYLLKELFFHNITSLADDEVANIRLMLCDLLPKMKTAAMDPEDPKLLASIDLCAEKLSKDLDPGVQMAFKAALNLMDDPGAFKTMKNFLNNPGSASAQAGSPRYAPAVAPLTDIRSYPSTSGRATTLPATTTTTRPTTSQQQRRHSTAGIPKTNSHMADDVSRSSSLSRPKARTSNSQSRLNKPPGDAKPSTSSNQRRK